MSKMGELAAAVEIAERIDRANMRSRMSEGLTKIESTDLVSDRTADLYRRRNTDPLTSHLAAKRVGEFEQQVSERILAAMQPYGLTTHEIADLAGLREDQVHKRMPELERHARVTVHCDADGVPFTREGPSGRLCRLWRKV